MINLTNLLKKINKIKKKLIPILRQNDHSRFHTIANMSQVITWSSISFRREIWHKIAPEPSIIRLWYTNTPWLSALWISRAFNCFPVVIGYRRVDVGSWAGLNICDFSCLAVLEHWDYLFQFLFNFRAKLQTHPSNLLLNFSLAL